MKKLGIIDIGSGNLYNLIKSIKKFNVDIKVIDDHKKMQYLDGLLIPGVGAFSSGIKALKNKNYIDEINKFKNSFKPILGICLGMQLLLSFSKEFGNHKGLNLIPGSVIPIPYQNGWPVPNIGWCDININLKQQEPFQGINLKSNFYFIHSFYCKPENYKHIVGSIKYGSIEIPAIIKNKNIFGCQFHPELSGESGLEILSNFIKMI